MIMQHLKHMTYDEIIQKLLMRKMNLHLGRVHIDVHHVRIHPDMQYDERKLVLHEVLPVSLFKCSGNDLVPDISSVDKKGFEIAVRSVDDRLSEIPFHDQPVLLCADRNKRTCNVTPVDPVDQLLQIPVSRGMKTVILIIDEMKGNRRIVKCHMLHQIADIAALCLRML